MKKVHILLRRAVSYLSVIGDIIYMNFYFSVLKDNWSHENDTGLDTCKYTENQLEHVTSVLSEASSALDSKTFIAKSSTLEKATKPNNYQGQPSITDFCARHLHKLEADLATITDEAVVLNSACFHTEDYAEKVNLLWKNSLRIEANLLQLFKNQLHLTNSRIDEYFRNIRLFEQNFNVLVENLNNRNWKEDVEDKGNAHSYANDGSKAFINYFLITLFTVVVWSA